MTTAMASLRDCWYTVTPWFTFGDVPYDEREGLKRKRAVEHERNVDAATTTAAKKYGGKVEIVSPALLETWMSVDGYRHYQYVTRWKILPGRWTRFKRRWKR